jgi:DNA-directed RNA polymerase III subunit RPC8
VIAISPSEFETPTAVALEDNINKKYANKVIQKVGLCICLYDILNTSDGIVGQEGGNVHVNVTMRIVVFRPFKGEIIEAKINSAEPSGMRGKIYECLIFSYFSMLTVVDD